MTIETIQIKGTTGPIYRATLELVERYIRDHGLPEHLAIDCPRGNRILVTSDARLTRFISSSLLTFDWRGDAPSAFAVQVV